MAQQRVSGVGYAASLLLLTLVLLAGNHLLLTGRAVPIWDASNFYAPSQQLVGDFARAGRFLLWNPWTSGGSPDCADPQIGAFSPIQVGLGWLIADTELGFRFYWLAIWWLGAVGMLLCARHLGAPAWGACISAIGFATSGFFTGHAQHTSIIYSMAALPFLVWRFDRALITGRWLPAAQAGAIWGLSAVGGYPGLTILHGFFLALWAAGRWLSGSSREPATGDLERPGSRLREARWVLVALMLTFVCGVLVLAPTYVAFFTEGSGFSDRVGALSRERAVESNALHPAVLVSFATPYLPVLRAMNRSEPWNYTSISSASIYMPVTVLVLALAAPLTRPRQPWRWCLLALSVFFLLTSLGRTLPLRDWLYDLFLPFRYFRHASIFRGYYLFGLAALAASLSSDFVRQPPVRRRGLYRRMLIVSLPLAALALGVLVAIPRYLQQTGAAYPEARGWALALWILTVCVLSSAGFLSRLSPALVPGLLIVLTVADGYAALKLPRPVMYTSSHATTTVQRQAEELHTGDLELGASGSRRLRDSPLGRGKNNLNLYGKIPIFNSYSPFSMSRLQQRWLINEVLVDAATGTDRIWFAGEAPEVPAENRCFNAFAARSSDLGSPPMVLHPPEGHGAERKCRVIAGLPAALRLPATWVTYQPDRLVLEVEAPAEGWLLVTDRFGNGWRAWVDGRRTEIRRGSFLFRALRIPAGPSRIEMRYRPAGFPWLVAVSWVTLFALLLVPGALARIKKPAPAVTRAHLPV